MSAFRPLLVIALLLVAVAAVSLGASQTTQSDYGLAVADSVDVPDETTTYQNQEFEVTAIARVTEGEQVTVETHAPTGTTYDVHLYNSDQQIEDSEGASGDDTVRFDTSYLIGGSGSYTVVLEHDGVFERIHPLVVPAYGVTHDAPSETTVGDTITVNATVTRLDDTPIEAVEAVVATEEVTRRTELQALNSSAYGATLSTDGLSPGEYTAYVVVRGPKTTDGRHELIGISDTTSMTIASESTPTSAPTTTSEPTSTGDGSTGGSGGGGSTGGSGGGNNVATPVATETPPPTTVTTTPPTTTTTVTTSTPTARRSTTTPPPTAQPSAEPPTTDGVIEPSSPTASPATEPTTQTSGSPLGAFPLAWLSLALFGVYRYLR